MEDSGARAEKVARLVRPSSVLHGPSFSFLFRRGEKEGWGGPHAVRPPDHPPGHSTGGSDADCCEISDDRAGRVWGVGGMGYFMGSVPGWHKRLSSSSLEYVESGCVVLGCVLCDWSAYDLGVLISRSSREVRLLKLAIVTTIVTGKAGWV